MFTIDKIWNPKHSVFVLIFYLWGIVWYDVFTSVREYLITAVGKINKFHIFGNNNM